MKDIFLYKYLNILDIIVILVILSITSITVYLGRKKYRKSHTISNSSSSYFFEYIVMSRSLTLPLFIATLVASWYGGIFGVTEISFNNGIYCFLTQGIAWYISYLVFAFLVIKPISRYKAYTFPEMILKMFGKKSSILTAILNLFNVFPIAYSLSLGLLIQSIFGLNLVISTLIGSLFILSYTLKGGMRADVLSDSIHFVVMCSSVLLVVVFARYSFGGVSFLKQNLDPSYFSWLGNNSISSVIMWMIIALSTLINPSFYQKCFAMQDPKKLKVGILISILIWACFDCCTVLGGMYAKALYSNPELLSKILSSIQGISDNGGYNYIDISHLNSQPYLTMALSILPNGMKGFFISGILATIISTYDSLLIISSNTLCFDIIPYKFRSISLQKYSLLFVSLVSFGISLVFDGSIKEVWKTLGSFNAGTLLIPVVIGYIKPKLLKDNDFIIISLTGFISMAVATIIRKYIYSFDIETIFIGLITSGIVSCFCIVKKYITKTL